MSEYETLCAERDRILAQCIELKLRLQAALDREQEARREAMDLALEISRRKGGRAWVELKRAIGQAAGRR